MVILAPWAYYPVIRRFLISGYRGWQQRNNIATGVSSSAMKDVILQVAKGELRDIPSIASVLRGLVIMDLMIYRKLVVKVATNLNVPFNLHISGLDKFVPILEKMRSEGAVILLKWDGERGERDNGAYTAVVSGKVLKEDFFRMDADTMDDALAYVIVHYARRQWDFTE